MGYHWFTKKCDGMCDTCDCPVETATLSEQQHACGTPDALCDTTCVDRAYEFDEATSDSAASEATGSSENKQVSAPKESARE